MAKSVKLINGSPMPMIGLGTWKSNAGEGKQAVKSALDAGYRHLDCAMAYGNESEVGAAIKEGTIKREDLFVASKLWNTFHRQDDVVPALKDSLKKLGLSYLDLYLIHWPHAFQPGGESFPRDEQGNILYADIDLLETWKGMEQCVESGLTRAIGVSNFNSEQIQNILDNCQIQPAVNQVEIHPYFANEKLVTFCQERGLIMTAYSPLASGERLSPDEPLLLENPNLIKIGQKHNKSPAQVVLRWLLQRGITVIPKSINPSRIKQNIQVFDFVLSEEEMDAINSLNKNRRMVFPKAIEGGKEVFRDRNAPNFPFHIEF